MNKQSLCFLTLLLFWTSTTHSQPVDSTYSFYPLHVGDIWEYNWGNWVSNPPQHLYYQKNVVLYDTTMPNGMKYYAMQQADLDSNQVTVSFQRIDSTSGYVLFRDDTVDRATIYNLRSTSTGPDTVFGVPTQARWGGIVGSTFT